MAQVRITEKTCAKCGKTLPVKQFLPSKSKFFVDGFSPLCASCLESMVEGTDMRQVDEVFRWLDYPLNMQEWVELYQAHGIHALRLYSQLFFGQGFPENNWNETNRKLKEYLEKGTIERHVKQLDEEWMEKMFQKWRFKGTVEDYESLENMYVNLKKTQNVTTEIQEDYARKLCKMSLDVDKKMAKGEEYDDILKTMNSIIKAAEFTPKNSTSSADFDSVGELALYLSKKGWKPKFYDGKDRDEVDKTIKNVQLYNKRLIEGEPTIADQVANKRRSFKLIAELENSDTLDDVEAHRLEMAGYAVDEADEEIDLSDLV